MVVAREEAGLAPPDITGAEAAPSNYAKSTDQSLGATAAVTDERLSDNFADFQQFGSHVCHIMYI